jgi:hypothetical protein
MRSTGWHLPWLRSCPGFGVISTSPESVSASAKNGALPK